MITPDISRAIAVVKAVLDLETDDPGLLQLIKAGEKAKTVKDLPVWAQAVLHYATAKAE